MLLVVLFTTVVIFQIKMYEYLANVIKLKLAWIVVELNYDQKKSCLSGTEAVNPEYPKQ